VLEVRRYWQPRFLPAREDGRHPGRDERAAMARRVREALTRATSLRLRADVPVGAYLSGGLDSSATAALARAEVGELLATYAVRFTDAEFDEGRWQATMATRLGTVHHAMTTGADDLAGRLADVVWHAETPLLRTAPAPLLQLSAHVRAQGGKVVLTGEGADEVFCGYNILREAKVRAFWARQRRSPHRPRLLGRLYPYLAPSPPRILEQFYGQGLDRPEDPFFSHRPRWQNTGRMTTFLAADVRETLAAGAAEARLLCQLPDGFAAWGPVARAQSLELTTFLAGYLLCSQGDRMLLGNAVEGRFPFLDHEVVEMALELPAAARMPVLQEKALLKEAVADLVPGEIRRRPKQPYRAPDAGVLRTAAGRALIAEALAPDAIARTGFWEPARVAALRRKWEDRGLGSARETMALVGLITTQLLARQFGPQLEDRLAARALPPGAIAWRDEGTDGRTSPPERT
jgi:asparagine synthase (glutamine-hydrolysing)